MSKKVLAIIFAIVITISLVTGCSTSGAGSSTASLSGTVAGRDGKEITLPDKINAIISGAPNVTEMLVGLGLGDKIVAVDTNSADVEGISADIPKIDFMNPDAEKIISLKPDMVIASGMSKAGGTDDPLQPVSNTGVCVTYLPTSTTIQGVMDDITFVAEITGTSDKGKQITDDMKTEIDKISAIGKTITDKKKVYFEISPAPQIYTFGTGTFLNEMIDLIGAQNIFSDKDGWISASGESVVASNPQVILTNVNYNPDPVGEIKSRSGWGNVDAVKNGQVYVIDANASSRPSQNIIKALKEMAKAIYPDKYED